MKKIILLFFITCIFAFPINCMAKSPSSLDFCEAQTEATNLPFISSGYTEDGVYYEVYGEEITANPNTRLSIEIERTVVFTGRIFPPQTLDWVEIIGLYEYKGTLNLTSFYYDAANNKTTGIYSGIVTN